jgi:predicted enzyme involved in methoxymalonyl-ACP biosynthesis
VVEKARALALEEIRGTFIPTEKNPLVRDHYASLGFEPLGNERAETGITRWRLALDDFSPFDVSINLAEAY